MASVLRAESRVRGLTVRTAMLFLVPGAASQLYPERPVWAQRVARAHRRGGSGARAPAGRVGRPRCPSTALWPCSPPLFLNLCCGGRQVGYTTPRWKGALPGQGYYLPGWKPEYGTTAIAISGKDGPWGTGNDACMRNPPRATLLFRAPGAPCGLQRSPPVCVCVCVCV